MKIQRRSTSPTESARVVDVARLARVSTATVSRALNFPERVDPDTRNRVLRAVRQLHYEPHGAARSLRTQRTRTIGACIPNLGYSLFSLTVESVQAVFNAFDYTLLLAFTSYDESLELDEVRAMVRHGVDGLVLVGAQHNEDLYALLQAHCIPYVLTWSYREDHPSVGFDHRRAMVSVGAHLLELGHKRIATIMPTLGKNDRVRDRLAGLSDVLATNGTPLRPEYVTEASTSLAAARHAMGRLLSLRKPPTAVACGNDVVAVGALMECQSRGLQVPLDISITGFCETEIGQVQSPSLTTVRVPVAEMGRVAAEHLVDRIENSCEDAHIEIPTELVVHGSTGAAPSQRTLPHKRAVR